MITLFVLFYLASAIAFALGLSHSECLRYKRFCNRFGMDINYRVVTYFTYILLCIFFLPFVVIYLVSVILGNTAHNLNNRSE
jgi:hypothetical protein